MTSCKAARAKASNSTSAQSHVSLSSSYERGTRVTLCPWASSIEPHGRAGSPSHRSTESTERSFLANFATPPMTASSSSGWARPAITSKGLMRLSFQHRSAQEIRVSASGDTPAGRVCHLFLVPESSLANDITPCHADSSWPRGRQRVSRHSRQPLLPVVHAVRGGPDLFQSAFTQWCPVMVLRKAGDACNPKMV